MLQARKNKKSEAQPSGIVSNTLVLGISVEKKRPASPELNLPRNKKGAASSGSLFEAEVSEDSPFLSGDKGKGPVV